MPQALIPSLSGSHFRNHVGKSGETHREAHYRREQAQIKISGNLFRMRCRLLAPRPMERDPWMEDATAALPRCRAITRA